MVEKEAGTTDTLSPTVPEGKGSGRPSKPRAPASLAPGAVSVDVLGRGDAVERYTVLHKVGAGGMGEVYAAYDVVLDRKVALKVLRQTNAEFEMRLMREAQAMARLSHPNVVSVYDTGRVQGRLLLAMEFVHGMTLREWELKNKRTWKDALRVYVDAGRGLAAAHAAGLVHRDFKPENVLVSDQGQVKVTDFGLARALGEANEPDGVSRPSQPTPAEPWVPMRTVESRVSVTVAPSTTSLETPMTQTGTMMGTVGYMAPEQYLCEPIDARTDQFSFCVSLYQALYGEKPFPGKTANERMEATIIGRLVEAPKKTEVPTRIYRVLLRGLSTEREARYPSVGALLDDLTRAPVQRKWRTLVATSVVVSVGAVALFAQKSSQARQARVCSGAEEESAEVWNPDVQRRIEGAMVATGLPYAADTWQRTQRQVGEYMSHWTTVHRQTCEATRLRGHQSEAVMTLRMVCLEQRREEVRALTQVLAAADRDVVSKAHQAATALTNPDTCKDVTSLMAADPLPTDPALRAEVDAIRQGMASAGAYLEAGKYARARDEVEPLVLRAARIAYAPVQAEALLLDARAHAEVGTERDVSIREGAEAAFEADRGRVDGTRAQTAIRLMRWETDVGKFADAESWSKVAEAALHRAGDTGEGRAEWLTVSGVVLNRQGKHREAVERFREALETARRTSSEPQRLAEIERCLAVPLAALGQHDEAFHLAQDADSVMRQAVGDEHPSRIDFIYTLGQIAGEANHARISLGYFERAIALAEQVAPGYSRLPALYYNACSSQCELGDYAGALSNCEKAIASGLRMYGPESIHMSYAYGDTGDALAKLHRYPEAIDYYERAIRIDEKSGTEGVRTFLHALMGLGESYLHVGKPRDAVGALERALALSLTSEGHSEAYQSDGADVRFALARALWQSGTRTPRAVGLARAAANAFDHLADAAKAGEANRWLAAHVVR